ncbi:hypothetical protein JL722_8728 [Aureococcus anophagefferens]|nr:hypothetical protein JL722_8728 [Aureococcus anophagefferens]
MAREPLVLSDAERRMVEGTWPMELITDDARQPLAVSTATDFAMRVLLSDHLEDVVVFRGGGDALGLPTSACLPGWLLESIAAGDADGSSGASVLRFLRHAVEKHPEAAKTHKATVEFMNADGVQKEAKPKRRERSPVAAGDARARDLYVCELRRLRTYRRRPAFDLGKGPCALLGARRTKTCRHYQVADALGDLARWTLSWDTQDDGVFVGGRGAGKGLHVDQVLWSNVGHNYFGHKLLATWPPGAVSTELHASLLDSVLTPPLSEPQLAALRAASRVVLLRPGDVFLMSGGVAHATLSVSDDALNVTAYESLVTLHPAHARHFLRTGDTSGPYGTKRGAMPPDEVEEYKDLMIDALEAVALRPRPDARTARFDVAPADAFAFSTVLREVAAATAKLLVEADAYFDRHVRGA